MSEVKITGVDECLRRLNEMKRDTRGEVIREAITAEAEVMRQAIDSAAPVGDYSDRGGRRDYASGKKRPGPIKRNIIIYERKRSDLFTQAEADNAVSLLVGPSRQRGKPFYAFFVEKGFQHITKKSRIKRTRAGGISKTVHMGGTTVGPRPFVKAAFEACAIKAEKALIAVVKKAVGLS